MQKQPKDPPITQELQDWLDALKPGDKVGVEGGFDRAVIGTLLEYTLPKSNYSNLRFNVQAGNRDYIFSNNGYRHSQQQGRISIVPLTPNFQTTLDQEEHHKLMVAIQNTLRKDTLSIQQLKNALQALQTP